VIDLLNKLTLDNKFINQI